MGYVKLLINCVAPLIAVVLSMAPHGEGTWSRSCLSLKQSVLLGWSGGAGVLVYAPLKPKPKTVQVPGETLVVAAGLVLRSIARKPRNYFMFLVYSRRCSWAGHPPHHQEARNWSSVWLRLSSVLVLRSIIRKSKTAQVYS